MKIHTEYSQHTPDTVLWTTMSEDRIANPNISCTGRQATLYGTSRWFLYRNGYDVCDPVESEADAVLWVEFGVLPLGVLP